MKKFISLFFVCLSITTVVRAQIHLSGSVRSSDSLPIFNATILLHDQSSAEKPIVAFATSDAQGAYFMHVVQEKSSYLLTVKALSHETVERPLNIAAGTTAVREDFLLQRSVSYLDTVKVNLRIAISKTGDTITFDPNAFALKNETTVEALLSRLPGMEIKEGGKIYFNGKPITGVLVDGDDLFKKNYQLLTQNAAPAIVDKVQVLKNYQKDQLLKEFNQYGSQVINLQLKEQYKNYLFGHGTAGYGNKQHKVAELFLVRLAPGIKLQSGVNYNNTGTVYTSPHLAASAPSSGEASFFSFQAAPDLLGINRYHFYNLPAYYQDRNASVQISANALLKKKGWENVLNAKLAKDILNDDQTLTQTYADGTRLFTDNLGRLRLQLHDYSYTGSKSTKRQSFYVNTLLQAQTGSYRLNTTSNQALHATQNLHGDDYSWRVNLAFHKKLKERVLWSTVFGYFKQDKESVLVTLPDFLFWLFPDDLSLAELTSDARIRLRQLGFKTGLSIKNTLLTHDFSVGFRSQSRALVSSLIVSNMDDHVRTVPFENNSNLQDSHLTIDYKGALKLPRRSLLSLKLAAEPHALRHQFITDRDEQSKLFYDFAVGLSHRQRIANAALHIGHRKRADRQELFFPSLVQTSFHRLQAGRLNPDGIKSDYLQASYNLFSVRMGLIAFGLVNYSRDRQDLISWVETKGIGTIHSFYFYPNHTHQLTAIMHLQKTLGALPFFLNTEVLYNRQSLINKFNEAIHKSDLDFLTAKVGLKSQFKSVANFDYNLSLIRAQNMTRSPYQTTSSTNTWLQKMNLYITPHGVFNSTVTYHGMVSNSGTFEAHFLDLALHRKFADKRVLIEFLWKNIFDRRHISNTTIHALYKQESRVEIRGATVYLTCRYEIR